jgi:hypothetical protein
VSDKLNKTDRAKYDRLMRGYKKYPHEYQVKLIQFSEDMDEKYGKHMSEVKGFSKGGVVKKKMMRGGMAKKTTAKKKMMRGGMAAKTAPKRMRGGGMMKAASKKKMMRGGMAKKKK